jgi:SAM-dependent methyltransferase
MSERTESGENVGAYARKQLFGGNIFLSWSHRARFRFAMGFVRKAKPRELLDYGCGDGTFLCLIGRRGWRLVGCDADLNQLEQCKRRFPEGIEFFPAEEISGSFDMVTCMEVLEHCTAKQRFEIYRRIRGATCGNARILFSVPIEIGPTLFFKQLIRLFLAMAKFGDYEHRETYSPGEFVKMFFAGRRTAIVRPLYRSEANGKVNEWHGHKGFNWKALEDELASEFFLERVYFTPNGFSFGLLSSQAWFLCRKRG